MGTGAVASHDLLDRTGAAELDRPTTAELHYRIVTDERLAPLATAITQSGSP
jgi:hypothetical protein